MKTLVLGFVVALCAGGLPGCKKGDGAVEKPTAEECRRSYMKLVELASADWPEKRRKEYREVQRNSDGLRRSVKACVEDGSRKKVRCILASKTEAEAKKCKR